jgi:energy-converting hydrogenase B subunit Q
VSHAAVIQQRRGGTPRPTRVWGGLTYHARVPEQVSQLALVLTTRSGPGVLHEVSGIIAAHQGDITTFTIVDHGEAQTRLLLEVSVPDGESLLAALEAAGSVMAIERVATFQHVFGKRVIIMGGGAQVGQVAIGAIAEADRHNIRGEKISVDTIPLVGEQPLAEAVRAVSRLPRARVLVLAGSLMGGEIEKAVREVRAQGLTVISLNMAGSVPDASDLVVTDPVQAGVMAVMAIADTARFRIDRLSKRVF